MTTAMQYWSARIIDIGIAFICEGETYGDKPYL